MKRALKLVDLRGPYSMHVNSTFYLVRTFNADVLSRARFPRRSSVHSYVCATVAGIEQRPPRG